MHILSLTAVIIRVLTATLRLWWLWLYWLSLYYLERACICPEVRPSNLTPGYMYWSEYAGYAYKTSPSCANQRAGERSGDLKHNFSLILNILFEYILVALLSLVAGILIPVRTRMYYSNRNQIDRPRGDISTYLIKILGDLLSSLTLDLVVHTFTVQL